MANLDHEESTRRADARKRLLAVGGDAIPRAPWLPESAHPEAIALIQFAAWRVASSRPSGPELLAALALLPDARAEIDQIEATLLRAARAHGLSWSRISHAMGLRSPQAAQQRLSRVGGRADANPSETSNDARPRNEYAGRTA